MESRPKHQLRASVFAPREHETDEVPTFIPGAGQDEGTGVLQVGEACIYVSSVQDLVTLLLAA